jgi:hypothetical protein
MKFTGIYHDYSELWILLSSCLREGTDWRFREETAEGTAAI